MLFSTATDQDCYIRITTPQGDQRDYPKKLTKCERYDDYVLLVSSDNNLEICDWKIGQAAAYGYTLEELETYLLGILNTGCAGSGGGGGGNSIISITHQDLLDLKNSETLSAGTYYAINDFRTVYDQPDFESDGTPKTSVVTKIADDFETLILFATSESTFAEQINSIEHPNDVIKYDINFSVTEYMERPAVGRITYREDVINGNGADYDFRNILLKSYESSPGSGIYNEWKDNGGDYIETLTFGNSYNDGTFIKGNVIAGMRSLGALVSYPFLICNVVINVSTFALGNTLNVLTRNCRFGTGLTGANINSGANIITGTDLRNFKNMGNISNVRIGDNTNSLTFCTATVGFTMGSNCGNIHFEHSVENVTIGDNNNNWECNSEITNITADNELSNINNLCIGNYVDGGAWSNFITSTTHPELYSGSHKKEIVRASDDNIYSLWFDGTMMQSLIID
ncbi:MAG: hypothetical protein U0T69_11165 [Chitinophagales bacterium]